MSPRLTKSTVIAMIAAAVAAVIAYAFFSPQTEDQALQNDHGSLGPASHQPPLPPLNTVPQAPAQPGASPQPPASVPRQ